jgi:NADPH:quinone reductase-like Zn-dependent oxidoreductase
MKAAVRSKYGLPEVISIKEFEIATPKENNVLIRVRAITVNRSDCHVLWGKSFFMRLCTGLFKPRLTSAGSDFAGEIVKVHDGVQTFKMGDKVIGFGSVFGCGSHAQYLTLSETKAMIIMPDTLNYEEEAAACFADMIAVKGDPLKDISELQRVKFLILGGKGIKNEK